MSRPRIAVPMSYGLGVRYLVSSGLLRQLVSEFEPIVGLTWNDSKLSAEITRCGGVSVVLPPPELGHPYRKVERGLDACFHRRLRSPTTAITRRSRRRLNPAKTRFLTQARQSAERLSARRSGTEARLLLAEQQALSATNLAAYDDWLCEHRIDGVLSLTPYHGEDQLLLWAATRRGIPVLSSIISFDNPTTRGRMPVLGDRVLVWNRHNREEVLRSYPELDAGQVKVVGAPQFDLHHQVDRVLDEALWRRRMGLPADGSVILYAAGPGDLLPGEPRLVEAINGVIQSGRIPGHPTLLLRGHPADPIERWASVAQLDHVVLSPGWGRADGGRSWPTDEDIADQMSTLAHAAAHISICSTMAIDGAAFDRPVITPRFIPGSSRFERRSVSLLYRQEHWRAVGASGGVTPVDDLDELGVAVARHLGDPALGREGRRGLVRELLTFDDGAASARVVAELVDLIRPWQTSSGCWGKS